MSRFGPVPIPAEVRFWRHVRKSEPCWLWQGAKSTSGYGRFNRFQAHRFAYEQVHGPIRDGLQCLHHCDVRNCVRPDHLFLGTLQDNMDDAKAKGRFASGPRHGLNRYPDRRVRGERDGTAKLTAELVAIIRRRRQETGLSYQRLGREFGISAQQAYDVVNRRAWRHVA